MKELIKINRKLVFMLKHLEGRIVVMADKEQKNYCTLEGGSIISLERDYNNLDRSYTQQVLGTVVDGKDIPAGALILFHFNSLHDSYKIFNHTPLSGEQIAAGIEMYSIPEEMCYLWKTDKEWQPCRGIAIGERVWEPYSGIIQGIEPKKIKDTLYIKTGEFKGKVVATLKAAADYQIIFRNEKGRDETIIRCRHYEEEDHERNEIVAIRHDLTEKVNEGKLLIGLSASTAKIWMNKN
jgi:hypothetical protein